MPPASRVLFAHNSEKIGGANRVLLGLFELLDRTRFEPWALLPTAGPMDAELAARDIPRIHCDVLQPVTTGSRVHRAIAAGALALRLKHARFHLLHAQGPVSYKIPSAVLRITRSGLLCHLHFPRAVEESDKGLKWLFGVRPHHVIACSRGVAASYRPFLQELLPDTHLHTIANFADTHRFSPDEPSALMRQLRESRHADHVVSICGQLSRRKGHFDFLQMAQRVLPSFPSTHFIVLGEDLGAAGTIKAELERCAIEFGIRNSVTFLGFQRDVPSVLRASDVVVLPSYAEGMPLSLLEASACGKPVVAYRIDGVDEVVRDGETGVLVEKGNVTTLGNTVKMLLGNAELRSTMGAAGRAMVQREFSLKTYATRVQDFYDDVLRDRNRSRS